MNDYYIVVSFLNNPKGYYFSVDNPSLKIGDKVIVETAIGKEVGIIKEDPKPINELNFDKEIKPILRKAIKNDLKLEEENKKLAISAGNIFVQEVSNLKLDMRLISTEYTLDRAKILFTYASEERIDFRDLLKADEEGNELARLARAAFAYRVAKYIGSYMAAMNGIDAIAFCAGVGENAVYIRGMIVEHLGFLGVKLNQEVNIKTIGTEAIISTPDSKVKVCVIPTNEELVIAQDTYEIVKNL